MRGTDYSREYTNKTDEELMRLALYPEQLIPAACAALQEQLAKRAINSRRLDTFREQEKQRDAEDRRDMAPLFLIPHIGIGRMRYGRGHRSLESSTSIECFTTTVFLVVFWIPLIPIGTYLVEGKQSSWFDWYLQKQLKVLDKLPLDWEQVLKIWIVSVIVFWGLASAVKLFVFR